MKMLNIVNGTFMKNVWRNAKALVKASNGKIKLRGGKDSAFARAFRALRIEVIAKRNEAYDIVKRKINNLGENKAFKDDTELNVGELLAIDERAHALGLRYMWHFYVGLTFGTVVKQLACNYVALKDGGFI